jgi:hypothetical protein
MTKDELKTWLISRGYTEDTFGHFKNTIGEQTYRYKIQDISVRREVQYANSDGSHYWARLSTGYLKNLSINDKNQIVGLKR